MASSVTVDGAGRAATSAVVSVPSELDAAGMCSGTARSWHRPCSSVLMSSAKPATRSIPPIKSSSVSPSFHCTPKLNDDPGFGMALMLPVSMSAPNRLGGLTVSTRMSRPAPRLSVS